MVRFQPAPVPRASVTVSGRFQLAVWSVPSSVSVIETDEPLVIDMEPAPLTVAVAVTVPATAAAASASAAVTAATRNAIRCFMDGMLGAGRRDLGAPRYGSGWGAAEATLVHSFEVPRCVRSRSRACASLTRRRDAHATVTPTTPAITR